MQFPRWIKRNGRAIVSFVSGLIVLAFAAGLVYAAMTAPKPAQTDTYAGQQGDQDAMFVDPWTLGSIPGNIADPFRSCPDDKDAYITTGNAPARIDVAALKPCLSGAIVVTLDNMGITVNQAGPAGYSVTAASAQIDTEDGKTHFTTLTYQLGNDTLFIGAVRSKAGTKGVWSSWHPVDDPTVNYPNGGYMTSIYTYQIAIFGENAAHNDVTTTFPLPDGFNWGIFLSQFLAS